MAKGRKKPKSSGGWWEARASRCAVWSGSELCYLVHFPGWGRAPVIVALAPLWDEFRCPGGFLEAGLTDGIFPMKKPVQQSPTFSGYAAMIEGLVDLAPCLAEHLTSTAYDGDAPGTRQTSTVTIFAQDGMWKATLRDRQEKRVLFVSVALFKDLFSVLEEALLSPDTVWRDDRASGAPEAKRQNPPKRT